jgi:hypothetical protein
VRPTPCPVVAWSFLVHRVPDHRIRALRALAQENRRLVNAAAMRRVAAASAASALAGSLDKQEAPPVRADEASSTATVSRTARGCNTNAA